MVASSGTRYYAGVPSIELKTGGLTQIALKPQDHGTRLTVRLPEVPENVRRSVPSFVTLSRNPGLLLWHDGYAHGFEDPRLGRLMQQSLGIWVAPQAATFTIDNLPPREYSVFAGPPVLFQAARVNLATNGDEVIHLAWAEPKGMAQVRVDGLSGTVHLEQREYTAHELCEILTGATGAIPPFQAASSIRNERVEFMAQETSAWNVLESLYLSQGWTLHEEGAERLILGPRAK
jgi:hypothetical protein